MSGGAVSKQNKGSEPIKVTDKRIFTSDGEIREVFKQQVTPSAPAEPSPRQEEVKAETKPQDAPQPQNERRKTVRDKAENPGTPFSLFLESLVLNAYMSLGMIRNPYQQTPIDLAAARQMIDIVTMLAEKTKGNLTEDESDYLETHLGELKLAFVQRSKQI
jgi:hypothetical protein